MADKLGVGFAETPEALLASDVDAFVIATATPGHAPLLRLGIEAGVPTFCEKPVASTLDETLGLAKLVEGSDVPVHVGFQRRFDRGYQRARQAVADGELGFVHTIRASTHDQAPPHAAYIPTSGGLFRDCSIHDFDIVRFVSGHEVASVFASGANKGASFFSEAGDVDTAAAILTLDDGTLVTVTATRYNGGGHDVRMEVFGSDGTIGVGYDQSLAVTSAEEGGDLTRGPRHWSFMERFLPAYRAELTAFADVARAAALAVHGPRRDAGVPHCGGVRPVASRGPGGPSRRDPLRMSAATESAPYDLITIGRTGVDIYPLDHGVGLEDVRTFEKFLGGSATNVAVAAARYGRRTAIVTRTGRDPFGTYVKRQLRALGVDDAFVEPVDGPPTPVTFCEIFPPDSFPLYFYRYPIAPDLLIDPETLPLQAIQDATIYWSTVTGLSQEPSRAAHFAAWEARGRRTHTVLDLDWRPMFWPDAYRGAPRSRRRSST